MKISKRVWGLAALVLGALIFMLWLADLLHFDKIAPGTVPPQAEAGKGREYVVREQTIPQELPVMAQVMSQTLTQISSQVPGRVTKLHVEAGSRVRQGAPLVALSAEEFQARLRQAHAGVSQATAHLKQVSADHRRYQRLLKEGAVSPREFEAMEARYRTAQASLAQAQAQVQEAATLEHYTVVRAPRDGVVAQRRAAVGDLAQPGQPLLTLYNPQDLQVEGEVNDEYRSHLTPGMQVGLTIPAIHYSGNVALTEIFPISTTPSRTFKVRTERLAIPSLIPGLFARLSIPLGESRGLLIPQVAVRRVGQLTMVEVMKKGRPSSRLVQLGKEVADQVEVLAGLQAGERILIP